MMNSQEFPASSGVRFGTFTANGSGSFPVRGTEILQAMWHSQNKIKGFSKKSCFPSCTIEDGLKGCLIECQKYEQSGG